MADQEITQGKTAKVKGPRKSRGAKKSEEKSPEPVLEREDLTIHAEVSGEKEAAQDTPAPAPTATDQMAGLIRHERFQEIINDLRDRDHIRNDKGQEIDFDGEAKEAFLSDVEGAYPVFQSALNSLYETGNYLFEVRERQKRNHLWMKYQEVIGQSSGFINNYIRVYEKFGERLPEFSYLGVSKLEVVARLKEPVAYIEANQEALGKASYSEVRQRIRSEKEKGVKHRSKRTGTYEDLGALRLKLSSNGRSLTISNLNKELQKGLMEVIKNHLSQRK